MTKGSGPLKVEVIKWLLLLVYIKAVSYMLWGLFTKVLKALGNKVYRAPNESKASKTVHAKKYNYQPGRLVPSNKQTTIERPNKQT